MDELEHHLADLARSKPVARQPDDGHAHCWHSTGIVLFTYPPKYPEFCCFCGEKRVRQADLDDPFAGNHGPYRKGRDGV